MELMSQAFGVDFQNPVLLASGSCGFGREVSGVLDLDLLGGFITKSVTVEPRAGNPPPRITERDWTMINSVGLANPGLGEVRSRHLPWIAHNVRRAAVFVGVAGGLPEEYAEVARTLDGEDGFVGFELNLSCPNALTKDGATVAHDPAAVRAVVSRCREVTDRPLLVKLGPALPDLVSSVRSAVDAGADALTLVNSLPATAPEFAPNVSRLGAGQGALTGPPLRPHALAALSQARLVTELPLIGVGGVAVAADAVRYARAGASLVQLCTAVFAAPRAPVSIISGLTRWTAAPPVRSWTELGHPCG